MTFENAVAATREVMKDSGIQDEGLAKHQALDFINGLATSDTTDPLLRVEAASIAFALYRGEENSE
jgi:hypothetical protein